MKSAYTRLKVPTFVLQTVGIGQERLCREGKGESNTCSYWTFHLLLCYFAKTDLFDEGLGLLEHTTRKSTYLQYPVKPKSPSVTKSTKTFENCLVEWSA